MVSYLSPKHSVVWAIQLRTVLFRKYLTRLENLDSNQLFYSAGFKLIHPVLRNYHYKISHGSEVQIFPNVINRNPS